MKIRLLLIFLLLVLFSNAQTIATNKTDVLDNECQTPTRDDYKLLCGDVASKAKVDEKETKYYEYVYEKRILQLSCVNLEVDDDQTIKRKVQQFWNKYKTNCTCDSVSFNIPNGNILKFSIAKNFLDFLDTFVLNYNLDINFIDPADGKNLLDYLNDEIEKLKTNGASNSSIQVYQHYRDEIISLGGKPSK
ncbi:hypothetical protein [Halpernia sp. GG3]